jgi:hypothetical protein
MVRKLTGLVVVLLLGVVLVACGAEDEDEPTAEPTTAEETQAVENTPDATEAGEPTGTPAVVVDDDAATPAATAGLTRPEVTGTPAVGGADAPELATPDAATSVASPVDAGGGNPIATPASTPIASPIASPVTEESTPDAAGGMVVPPQGEPTEAPQMIQLAGEVVLNGSENEAFVLTAEGCVGLGQYANLREGRQVVVRNEAGTIVAVTELEGTNGGDDCAWDFVAQVPESDFYSVSVPMTFERVFPKAQVNEGGGEVVVELP